MPSIIGSVSCSTGSTNPRWFASPPHSLLCSSSAAPSHLGDGVLWPDPFSGRPGAAATYSNFNMRWGIAFYNAGVNYSAAIQPYALKLFFALFLIDIIVTWIQYSAEGQLDPSFFLGRMIKHVLSGGF